MRSELRNLIKLCEDAAPNAFQNGVTHSGIDQGDVFAAETIAKAKEALRRKDIEAAARALLEKLVRITASKEFLSVFTLAYVHGEEYSGETYEEEIASLKEALDS